MSPTYQAISPTAGLDIPSHFTHSWARHTKPFHPQLGSTYRAISPTAGLDIQSHFTHSWPRHTEPFHPQLASTYRAISPTAGLDIQSHFTPLGLLLCPQCVQVLRNNLSRSDDRLVGLVVRRPPRERKIPGSNPACAGIFSGSSHTSDSKIGTPVATLGSALGLVGRVSVYCDWVR